MKICKGCGNEHRKSKQTLLVANDGSVSSARVCLDCMARAVRIVATLKAPVIREERKRTGDDVARVVRMLETYAKVATAVAGEEQGKETGLFLTGRADGISTAIQTIRRELGGES